MEDLCKPSDVERNVVHVHQIKVGPSWMDLIVLFLKEDFLPESKSEADKVRRKAPWFWLSENQKLYKRSFYGPYLLCIHLEAVELLLEELHEGICRSHTGGGSLSHRALTQGIGGQICRKKHKNMLRSATNAKDLHQTFINLEESSITVQPLAFRTMGLRHCRSFH